MSRLYALEAASDVGVLEDAERRTDRPRNPWLWMALATTLLSAAALETTWQDWRFASEAEHVLAPTFPLKELPTTINDPYHGVWKLAAGKEISLDPQITRIAGSTDSLVRTYVNTATGVSIDVLVLYGRAERVSGHTPEVCYPAIGYEAIENTADTGIGGSPPKRMRSCRNPSRPRSSSDPPSTRKGSNLRREEVYYAFRQFGRWSPEVTGNWKALSADPALFKVQTQRRVGEQERRILKNPTEEFLEGFVTEVEKRIVAEEGEQVNAMFRAAYGETESDRPRRRTRRFVLSSRRGYRDGSRARPPVARGIATRPARPAARSPREGIRGTTTGRGQDAP